MSSPNDVSMEEIPLEDDERDSIEYKILMAYAQRRLSGSKYGNLLRNEANVKKSSSLIRRKVKMVHLDPFDGQSQRIVFQGGGFRNQGKEQVKAKSLSTSNRSFLSGREKREKPPVPLLQGRRTVNFSISETQPEILSQGNSQHQTSETADVNHIADKLAKLVTSRSQESPSDVSFRMMYHAPRQEQDNSQPADGHKGEEHDEEKIIQEIVSLLRQSGDRLEEKIKKDRLFYQCFKEMLSYTFFERITDTFLENVSADSTNEPRGQVQLTKVAFTMELATRLTAVDNHPMNLVLGFGLKYLREHFKPWIQDQGGWEKALTSLDQEEVE
ncbi:apoptosis facilitator Bcl-2-like protein 14 [Athene cunicularia]|uniref:apoptosis facilitator Bcl-2-like protein 14 n=1 Tax=Athene cunicularia TaxID=194338 RepID=UPI000EF6DC97|nr:apoptosis facilitator Bcl-2-like protein 14 [Athene cunicularia]